MITQISSIEISPELANMAYEMGLNIQKTCENALKEAIRRLQGFNPENTSVRNAEAAGSNPARSTTKFSGVSLAFLICERKHANR